jgi:hypothetical protein
VLVAIPLTIAGLRQVRRYYDALADDLREAGPMEVKELLPPTVVVVMKEWDRLTERAVKFALTISPDVVAVHLSRLEGPDDGEEQLRLKQQWQQEVEAPVAAAGFNPPRFMLVPAPYRQIHEPLLRLIWALDAERPERTVTVLIPQIVKVVWWQNLFHQHRASRLRSALLREGGPRLTVISVPWRIDPGNGLE